MADDADQDRDEAAPAPRDADAVRPVIVGTIAWALAGLFLLIRHDALADEGRTWWLGACAAGVALGLLGTWVVIRRRRAYRAAGRDAG
jgi:hypothetical protein